MEWSTACLDWKERLVEGRSIIPPPLFPDQAEQSVAIFKQLKIVDAPGSPTFGEACDQWVFDLVASIFGADMNPGRQISVQCTLIEDHSRAEPVSTSAGGHAID
ncbi:hypothetical protein OU994_15710 [Pseudoduganella sp. SL102]|uniref:hypothetical protein n=1 Tax=Pseudoduganella sp. SL102 TaxID=2995154 RepID=UPI00248B5A65|nr:hypothetical protein [Pseudoduganella sp. SL102]WBS05629.1 hypothetical protein OU994_15710 [Pseudoduganella sp. SL102]